MKGKKILIGLASIIMVCILINIGFEITKEGRRDKAVNEYKEKSDKRISDSMRFDVDIEAGSYEYVVGEVSYDPHSSSFDNEFNSKSQILKVDSSYKTKFSKYVITRGASYIKVLNDGQVIYLKHNVPIDEIKRERIIMLLEGSNTVEVEPFNDGIYAFVNIDIRNFIMNLDTGEKTWEPGGYYESPEYNVYSDTVNCDGDLDFTRTTYMIDKYGELIGERKPAENYEMIIRIVTGVVTTVCIIGILFIINRLIKNKGIRFIGYFILSIITVIVLWASLILSLVIL